MKPRSENLGLEPLYIWMCGKCRKETKHIVVAQSRKRGVKLRCLNCERVGKKYRNFQTITQYLYTEKDEYSLDDV